MAGHDLIYGRNSVLEALRAGRRVRRVFISATAHGRAVDELCDEARRRGVAISPVDRRQLDRIAGDEHHQGVVAETALFAYSRLDALLEVAKDRGEPPLLLVLDSLQDPQNFGTLLRTALGTGVHGVVIPEHRAVGVTPAVSKASAGAVEHLAIARERNLPRALGVLKKQNVWVYGLAVDARQPFWEVDWTGASALVVGAEGHGLGRLVRERCDVLVQVPMAAYAPQSLNAATAGSLALYEAFRRRRDSAAAARPSPAEQTLA